MVHVMPRVKLAYFPVPKIACTSIKEFLFEIGYGHPFEPTERADGTTLYIHGFIRTDAFDFLDLSRFEGFRRIAVVRDPIARLLSAYGNRVMHHGELSKDAAGPALAERGLPADPDLATFVDNLDSYRAAAPSIHHHTEPMITYLGTNPSYFTRVYRFAELGTLAKDIRTLTGVTAQMPRRQTGGPKFTASDLTSAQIERLRAFYGADYTFLERLDALDARRTPRHPPAGDTP